MDFPVFQVPGLGHGMVIGGNAVVHVFLSHGIAIGVFTFIVLAEAIGVLGKRPEWDRFAHHAIIPTAVIISSVSSITGVGIWFTIGTLAPRAAASMLRIFFWPWFVEWIVFFAEAVILLVYYMAWTPLVTTPRRRKVHLAVGALYPVGGFLSAFLITGIIGFMLTPGQWPWQQSRWSAFFNPSLWPQTFLRFFGGLALGAIMASGLALTWKHGTREFRRAAVRLYGAFLIVFASATAVCAFFYFRAVPATFKSNLLSGVLTSHLARVPSIFWIWFWVALALLALFAVMALLGRSRLAKLTLIPALLAGFAFTAGYERIREFIRGPYVMSSYMYASEVPVAEMPVMVQEGMLPSSYWYNAATNPGVARTAETLWVHNCNTCHTSGGLNDIRDRLAGRSRDGVAAILAHTNEMVPWMPHFSGSPSERELLADYLFALTAKRASPPPSRLPAGPVMAEPSESPTAWARGARP